MADNSSTSYFYTNASEHDKFSLVIHMFSTLSLSKVTQYDTPQLKEDVRQMVDMFFEGVKDELKVAFGLNNKEHSAAAESNWADRLDAQGPKKLRRYGA